MIEKKSGPISQITLTWFHNHWLPLTASPWASLWRPEDLSRSQRTPLNLLRSPLGVCQLLFCLAGFPCATYPGLSVETGTGSGPGTSLSDSEDSICTHLPLFFRQTIRCFDWTPGLVL